MQMEQDVEYPSHLDYTRDYTLNQLPYEARSIVHPIRGPQYECNENLGESTTMHLFHLRNGLYGSKLYGESTWI